MPIRDVLPAILRGAEAADLGPESRDKLESIAHDAFTEGELHFIKDECTARLRQPDPPVSLHYLMAAASALQGEVESAVQSLLRLGEMLTERKDWEALAAVAERSLGLETTQAGARLLVKAHEGLGKDPARLEALERASRILTDDLDVALLYCVRLGEAGEHDKRRERLTRLMPRFAKQERWAGLEEAALEFVEHKHIDGMIRLFRVLPTVAEKKAIGEAETLVGIGFPLLVEAKRAGEVEAELRAVTARAIELEGDAGAAPFRKPMMVSLRQAWTDRLPDAEKVFDATGLADNTKSLAAALERFDRIASLPPGGPVHHDSFGAGRIARNDGDEVYIDFARRPGHRMPFDAAKRTLSPVAENDLRLLAISDPAALAAMRKDEPGEVVVRALFSIGGEADAKKLKLFLVGSDLVPAKEWTAFWRRARSAAEKDPRIDHSRAFEQHYKLLPEGHEGAGADANVPLPPYQIRKPARTNLAAIRKFLVQHPQAVMPLARRFGRFVEKVMRDPHAELADRVRAGLYFSSWRPDLAHEWPPILKSLWDAGLMVGDLSQEDEQLALLDSAHAVGIEADAILSALNSRFAAVQKRANEYREHLDAAGRAALRRTMLDHAARYPAAALRLIEEALNASAAGAPAPDDAWRMFHASITLIEEKPKASVANKVLKWIEPGGPFDEMLHGIPCSEDMQMRIRVLLRQWRSSDRFMHPVLEAVDRMGHDETVDAVNRDRRASTDRMFEGVGEQADESDVPVMTRATWLKLQKDLEEYEYELRNVIPKAIQKARELGDLKENAEYHAAKDKQATMNKLVAALQQRISRTRFVEESEYEKGTAGLGTEVTLETDGEKRTYWILGDDEHHLGANVVSFQTPVARALLGRSVGEDVELGDGSEKKRYRITSVERKLPAAETESPR